MSTTSASLSPARASIDFVKVDTYGPGDLSARDVLAARGLSLDDVIAAVGKTEGNGCVNDFSRPLAARAWESVLPASAITVMSGGTEGVLTPHINLIVRSGSTSTGLIAAVGETDIIATSSLGRRAQVEAVAETVTALVGSLDVAADDVHMVLVKCPLLTSDDIAKLHELGDPPVVSDTYASMGESRRASALGVALALGERSSADVEAALAGAPAAWSSVASVSSGAELDTCHVIVVATSPEPGRLGAIHAVMRDALDAETVQSVLREVDRRGGTVVQLFAKAEADPSGRVRGRRHTMLTDSDIPATRHARAAVGGLLAGLAGDSSIYVSGGAEAQGPPGGGPLTVIYETTV